MDRQATTTPHLLCSRLGRSHKPQIVPDAPLTQRSATGLARAIREREVSSREVSRLISRCASVSSRAPARSLSSASRPHGRRPTRPTPASAAAGVSCRRCSGSVHDQGVIAVAACRTARGSSRGATTGRQHRPDGAAADRRRRDPARPHQCFGADIVDRVRQPRLRRSSTPYDPSRAAGVLRRRGPVSAAKDPHSGSARTSPARFASPRSTAACSGTSLMRARAAHGSYPVPHGEAKRLLSFGPLARRSEDLMPLLRSSQDRRRRPSRHGHACARGSAGVSLDGSGC